MIEQVQKIAPNSVVLPYGSRVYGTHKESSDHDFIVISDDYKTGHEIRRGDLNIHFYTRSDFQDQLTKHKISALECWFLPNYDISKSFKFQIDLPTLRSEISAKASNSFVKAKKKIDKEKDFYIGWKSLFHSLRILDFGSQIAEKGKIFDYSSANQYWFDILHANCYEWSWFKDTYQPIYNSLATQFRKLAPKEKK